jgi:tape measure domain-containing protein
MADSIQLGIRITADGKGAEGTINSLNRTIEKVGDSSRKASASLGGIEKATQGLSSAASTAGRALAGLGVAFSARQLIQTADAYSGIVAKLKLVSGSTQEFAAAQSQLFEISQRNMTPLAETVQLYSRLAYAMRDMGRSQSETVRMVDLIGKSLRISGASAAEMSSVLQQLSQALGGGVLRGEEFNALRENGQRTLRAIADGIGVTVGELKNMADAGKLTSDVVTKALLSQGKAIESEYTTMPVTVSGAFQQIQNALTAYVGQTDQANGASRELAEALSLIANNLNEILDPLSTVINTLVKIEVGGWLTLVDAIKAAKVELKEMVGLKDGGGAIDPEVVKLMRYGSGQASIGEIAGPPPQAAAAQKEFFDGVKRGANDAALAMTKLSEKQKAVAQIVIETAKAYKVDPAFALAIAQQESGFNQLAKSAVGARGVMQLMPGTAEQLGVNFNDLNDNIKGGVMYLAQQEKQFKSLRLAAAAYNAGPGNVQKFGGVPPFKETQNYVVSVGALYEKWQKVLGAQGEAFVSAKDQADELSTAFNRLKTHQDDQVKKAEEYAKVQVEQIKTRLAAMDQEREAAARLTAEQLAGAKTYEDRARIIEAAQAKAAEYNAQALEMVRAEYDAQQQALEAKKQAYQAELAQADKYNVSIDDQFKLKQAIRAADNDLLLLAENRAQAEITAAGKVNEFAKQSADLKRNEVTAIDGIIQAYQRQADILDRLTAAKQAGANADQLALLNDVYQSTGNLPELVSQDQIARMQQYILSTQALKGAVDELTGSQKKSQEQSVADEQLRLNQAWDEAAQRMIEYAKSYEEAFGRMGKSLAGVSEAMALYDKRLKQIDRDRKATIAKSGDDEAKKLGAEQKGQLETLGATFDMLGNVAGAMRNMYEEGTSGYKAMAVAQQALQMATQVTNIALGIQAILNQASGEPYSAIPRMIAMAGMVANLIGSAIGAFGGGGGGTRNDPNSSENRQKLAGTGTVLGDANAKSESIAKSLEIIRDNSSNDLTYSAAMLRALENIELSIKGTTNAALLNFRSIAAGMADGGKGYAGINENKSISDWGIAFPKALLSDIFKMGMDSGVAYVSNNRNGVDSKMLLDGITGPGKQIERTIIGISAALVEGGKTFGLTADDFKKRLSTFVVDLGIISLKGLSGDDMEKQLAAIMSNLSDKMAAAFMPGLESFQQVGEGYAQTFWRLAEGVNRAQGELERLGLSAIKYTQIINKQGDVAAEIVRQTLAGQKTLAVGVRQYVNELTGKADDIIAAYKKLIQASDKMKTAGIGDSNLDRTMINAAGGLDAFNAAMEAFNENFVSEADRYAGDVRVLAEQFGKFGQVMPSSKEGFAAMIRGIDQSTDAGKKLFGALIALAPAFAEMANQAEDIRAKYAAILDPFKAMGDQIKEVSNDFKTLLTGVTAGSTSRLDAITTGANNARDPLFAERNALMKRIKARFGGVAQMNEQIAYWERKLADELGKAPKKQNKEVIKTLKTKIARWSNLNSELNALNEELAQIMAKEGMDKAAEIARVSLEKQAIIDDAVTSMGATLEDVFSQIVQTVQASQQRLQSVVAVQKSLASQLAQLQGPGAVFDLANADRNSAFGAIDNYILGVQGGAGRNVETEVGLLNDAQAAVMARYNAEIAAIQEAEREYIAAETDRLNASLQLQIDAINAATEAAINAESDRLEAAIKAQGKLDQAEQKALNQRFDAEQKRLNKQFDAEQKALNKQFDQEQKALQKAHDVQMKALTDELDAANKLRDAIRNIQDYVRGMALGGSSPLSPEQRLAEAQRQYQDLLLKAQGGDAEAMGKLTGASDAYLEAAKQYYGSGTQYSSIFDGIKNAMTAIGGMSAPDPDSIQSRIDELRESQASQLEALRDLQSDQMDLLREQQSEQMDVLRDIQAEQMDLLREQQQDRLDALRTASQAVQDEIRKTAQAQIEAAQKATQQSIADLSDPNKNLAMRAAREAAERDLKELQRLAELTRIEAQKQADEAKAQAEQMARDALDLANRQLEELQAGTRVSRDTVAALNAILINAKLNPIPGYANGGLAGPGLAMVGERGPELVRFNRPGQVYNANDTRSMLADDQKIVAAIAELKAEMRAVVITQSNANPQIIAELSEMKTKLAKLERNQRIQA